MTLPPPVDGTESVALPPMIGGPVHDPHQTVTIPLWYFDRLVRRFYAHEPLRDAASDPTPVVSGPLSVPAPIEGGVRLPDPQTLRMFTGIPGFREVNPRTPRPVAPPPAVESPAPTPSTGGG